MWSLISPAVPPMLRTLPTPQYLPKTSHLPSSIGVLLSEKVPRESLQHLLVPLLVLKRVSFKTPKTPLRAHDGNESLGIHYNQNMLLLKLIRLGVKHPPLEVPRLVDPGRKTRLRQQQPLSLRHSPSLCRKIRPRILLDKNHKTCSLQIVQFVIFHVRYRTLPVLSEMPLQVHRVANIPRDLALKVQ